MKRALFSVAAAVVGIGSVFASACSSSSSGGTADSGAQDGAVQQEAAADAPPPNPNNCVPPGYKGNEKGIGAYCQPGYVECPTVAGAVLLCASEFGGPPEDSFCTTPCEKQSDCGSDAICVDNPLGQGCAPLRCIPDGGLEGGTDAAPDAPSDAAHE
jgi:hypothetical protein